ncbi:MAG: TIGR02452 family protein [Bacteroidales bacterium]|nr:TIGR02452 family protein [Bacteroidales bacterium]
MMDKHAQRIQIFNDTLELVRQGWYAAPGGQEVKLPPVEEVMEAAVMYKEPFHVLLDPIAPIETEVRVENKDCVLAAKDLIDAGYNPAMLNLADLYTPGGLVEYGSGAQEENLCRRSDLILSLYQFSRPRIRQYPDLGLVQHVDQYPMDERFGGIYSGIVSFFRGPESTGSQLEDKPYNIPVISVAALNGPRTGADGMMLQPEVDITLDKIRTIFRIGQAQFHDSLVLSALGCGAFANPPAHIARLFHQVIGEDEFRNSFRLIDFAILDGYRTGLTHNPEGNLKPFQREFDASTRTIGQKGSRPA